MQIKKIDISALLDSPRVTLGKDAVAETHQYTYATNKMDFNKDLNLKGKYCYHPFNTVTIDQRGDCFVCVCQAWLPISVGNIMDFNTLDEIVHSPRAREIQASIADGSFRYCDHKTCHLIVRDELETRINHKSDTVNWIVFAVDDSCNLQCPSCRTDLIFHKDGKDFEFRLKMMKHIAKLINQHRHFIRFTLSGDGDPFASHIYRKLLKTLKLTASHQVEIEIVTNGILVKKHWKEMVGVHGKVYRFKISFDAGTEEVYKITRRGGQWNKLLESTKYIIDWRNSHDPKMQISLNFVVQDSNYRDIVKFAQLGKELGVDEIGFQKVTDWGKFNVGGVNMFKQHAIWMPDHPKHQELLEILNHEELFDPRIELTNLSHLAKKHPDRPSSNTK